MVYNGGYKLNERQFMDNINNLNFSVEVRGEDFDKLWRLGCAYKAQGDARVMLVLLDVMEKTLNDLEEVGGDAEKIRATRAMIEAVRAQLKK